MSSVAGCDALRAALYTGGCGVLCLLEVLDAMRRVLLCIREGDVGDVGGGESVGDGGGDALCASLYAGGRGGWDLFAGRC